MIDPTENSYLSFVRLFLEEHKDNYQLHKNYETRIPMYLLKLSNYC